MLPGQHSTLEQTVLALAERQPLLRARDLTAQALPTVVLSRLVAAGKLERVARGVYSLPGRALSEHRSLAEVALRAPRGVVCLLSALRDGWAQRKLTMDALWHYAAVNRVANVMRPYLESVTA